MPNFWEADSQASPSAEGHVKVKLARPPRHLVVVAPTSSSWPSVAALGRRALTRPVLLLAYFNLIHVATHDMPATVSRAARLFREAG
jgi:hypothetical protein